MCVTGIVGPCWGIQSRNQTGNQRKEHCRSASSQKPLFHHGFTYGTHCLPYRSLWLWHLQQSSLIDFEKVSVGWEDRSGGEDDFHRPGLVGGANAKYVTSTFSLQSVTSEQGSYETSCASLIARLYWRSNTIRWFWSKMSHMIQASQM